MPHKHTEPYRHGTPARTAVLLINLGTPEAPTASAVRRYLREFLRDPRVVEIPRALWIPLLEGIIVPLRAPKTAAKYARIWDPAGSPLALATAAMQHGLQQELSRRGHHVLVRHAMRYGDPSIPDVLQELHAQGVTRVLGLPLYPQYSAATTATALDAAGAWLARTRRQPEWRWVRQFADDPGYIRALAQQVRGHWDQHGRPEQLLMSFHGMPRRTLDLGDPYHCECQKTARLLAQELQLDPALYKVTFQSRFGAQAWLQPYTEPTLRELAKSGVKRVDVICPGFAADCLETLEEIGLEAKQAFLSSGGSQFHYIPCLNAGETWIHALADLAQNHLQGWPTQAADEPQAVQASRARALALGASD